MVRKTRLSIAGLMGVVLVASLGLTSLRSGSEEWAGATTLVTCGLLALGVVGAACRERIERAWWLGFSLFGWGYLLLIFMEPYTSLYIPTSTLLEILRPPGVQGREGGARLIGHMILPSVSPLGAYGQAGHSLLGLACAVVGGLLAVLVFGRRSTTGAETVVSPVVEVRALQRRWRWRMVVAPLAFIAGAAVVLAGLRWAPWKSCAVAMFATWGLLGIAVVGAVCRPGRFRAAWLGAALFGIGYMALIFGRDPDRPSWPQAGTDLILRALRPSWYVREAPPPTAATVVTNTWIREVLERPITLRYPEETALGDVLNAIRAATRGPDGRGPVFYVDPIGLQEAEKSMTSPVIIDIEDVPLRTTLGLIFKQLDLEYGILDGVVFITSEKADEDLPASTGMDPYLSVGHCLLALLAAGLGAVLARRFCVPRNTLAAES